MCSWATDMCKQTLQILHICIKYMIFIYVYNLCMYRNVCTSKEANWAVGFVVSMCCSVLQCVAVCCSVLQSVAVTSKEANLAVGFVVDQKPLVLSSGELQRL